MSSNVTLRFHQIKNVLKRFSKIFSYLKEFCEDIKHFARRLT